MTSITCDLCGQKIVYGKISIRFLDGEHPHNRSEMTRTIDSCPTCAEKIPDLSSRIELDDAIDLVKK